MDDLNPEYMAVSFDLKAPTARHKIYDKYKANRHGMPDELREQMPMIKEVLKAMNIDIVEKEGFEGDDILGTLAKYGEKQGLDVVIQKLSPKVIILYGSKPDYIFQKYDTQIKIIQYQDDFYCKEGRVL